jgi:hypothetical protein
LTRHSDRMLMESLSSAFQSRTRPGLSTESVLLRPLEGGPLRANELWRHGRVSKRAMTTIVNAAARQGAVVVDGDEVRLLATLPPIEPASCPSLEALVSQFELEHPHFPVPYGTADPSFRGRGAGGVDWKPVPRQSASSVEGLPMTALLSQALVAFAIDYEKERRGPIQWAANILQSIGSDGADVSPAQKSGTSSVPNLQRLGIVTIDRDNVVRLTARGRAMRDAYNPLCEQVESQWRNRLGSSLIDDVVATLRVDGRWRPFPLITWTGAEFSVLSI